MMQQQLARSMIATFRSRPMCTNSKGVIGFIGLGNMGGHMAANLLKANRQVVAFDLSVPNLAKAEQAGAKILSSPAAVAEQAKTIITMLPSSPHVQDVYLQEDGILSKVQKGTLLIDCSTIDPGTSIQIATHALAAGAVFVDAPVSGGTIGAEKATLTFMVGCDEARFEDVKSILTPDMGKNVVHCGVVGAGQIAKICNNLILGVTMAGVCEAFQLGTTLGIDPKKLAGVINTSSGRCWSTQEYNPCPGVMEGVPSARDYEGGFACDLMAKDLSLAAAAAARAKVALPMGSVAHQMYLLMSARGMGRRDFSGLYKTLKLHDDLD